MGQVPRRDPRQGCPQAASDFGRGTLALALVVVFAGTALATVAVGFHPTVLSRATLSERVHYNTDRVKFQTKGAVDIATLTILTDPLGSSGWHTHPGVVLVSVLSGTLTVYDSDCTATVYPAGSAFTESGDEPGVVRNESTTTPSVTYVTFIVPVGAPLRIDQANPGCPQT